MPSFGQLLVGLLSDRFGRKWLVLGGLAVFVAGSVRRTTTRASPPLDFALVSA